MIKAIYYLAGIFLLLGAQLHAQTEHRFTTGLAAGPCHHYGREAIVNDALAYRLFAGQLAKPAEGQELLKTEDGEPVVWQTVTADTAGLFRGEALSNGYLYLTYESAAEQTALLNVTSHNMLFVNGEPRGGDIYGYGWMYAPVALKKGTNEIYIRCSRWARWRGVSARLLFPEKPVFIGTEDTTLPHIVTEETDRPLWGAVVVVNNTGKTLDGLHITSRLEGKEVTTPVPAIMSMTTRKVGFRFDPGAVKDKKKYTCSVSLLQKGKVMDSEDLTLDAVGADAHHSNTFISNIDGSVQYYAVAPQLDAGGKAPALFLSVHGAGVEAIGQARAYERKDWGVLVAPTNRRPRGFNWEDWGMLDGLEVLDIATKKYNPDPQRIYLTGHSMGGHGTWYMGATFPGRWAAIAPCAGYPSLIAYGSSDGQIPDRGRSTVESMLLQASSPSNVLELAPNYQAGGVYIHHGDSDKVVSVDYARQMREVLSKFHKDFSYYEYPGGSHWFSNQSVDWPPLFEYFKWHTIPHDSAVEVIDFTTASTAVSSQYHWATIMQQERALKYSRIELKRDKKRKTIAGTTKNVSIVALALADFVKGDTVTLTLDGEQLTYIVKNADEVAYLYKKNTWQPGGKPDPAQKGVNRNGTFREPFNHRMVFVYGTKGTAEENKWAYSKARYDAEVWYYRGNGAVDIVADRNFDPAAYPDRGVILYGNADTNRAWKKLLAECPIQVNGKSIRAGARQYTGSDLAAYFMWPRPDSKVASVGVVSGTGLTGMKATEANQYFAAGSGFPDYMIFSADMLKNGAEGVKTTGFYGNDWKVETGEWAE